jgi:hypothetical protein
MALVFDGSAGTITGVNATGISSAQTITSVPGSAMPAGTVLQVQQAYVTGASAAINSTTQADITGLSVTITPRNSSSKFLCIANIVLGIQGSAQHCYINLMRGSSNILVGDSAGTRGTGTTGLSTYADNYATHSVGISYMDSPATASAVTYKLGWYTDNTSGGTYLNRSYGDRNSTLYDARLTSQIIVMEIAA